MINKKDNTNHGVNICAFHEWPPRGTTPKYRTIVQSICSPVDLSSPETVT